MKGKTGHRPLAIVLAISTVLGGCAGETGKLPAAEALPLPLNRTPATSAASKASVSKRPPNHKGSVLILEYHHIKVGKGDMFRLPSDFKRDLERLYGMGFRPVTVSEYLDEKMDLAPGASPVVMTFDDSNPSQFQLKADGTADPNCAVGIWQAFAKEHPDFPIHATFYVLPDAMWAQPKLVAKKIQMLRSWGSELGNHTTTHPNLKRLSDEQVKRELATACDKLKAWGEKSPVSMALPLGIFPKNRKLVEGFTYNGRQYHIKAAMLVGANPALAPSDPKLNRYRIPRIQAYPGEMGSDYWLGQVQKGAVKVYVE